MDTLRHEYVRATHKERVCRALQEALEALREQLVADSDDPVRMGRAVADVITELCKWEGREAARKVRLRELFREPFDAGEAPGS